MAKAHTSFYRYKTTQDFNMDDYDIWGAIKCKILHLHSWVYDEITGYRVKTCVRCSKQKKKPLKNKRNDTDNHGSRSDGKEEQSN